MMDEHPPVVTCGPLRFVRVAWWHEDANQCNHYAAERVCANPNGEWLPVYVMRST